MPGGSCPLCGFPTFEWAEVSALGEATRVLVRKQFPNWTPEQGACNRGLEIYEQAGIFEVPATICL